MKNPRIVIMFTSLLLAFGHLHAQSDDSSNASVESNPDAQKQVSVTDANLDIRIRKAGTTTIKEFHQQGKVYKVEIAPANTPAYILSDQDGNGSLNSSDTSIDSDLVLPEWTIGNW